MKQYTVLLAIMSLLATKSFAKERVNILDKGAYSDGKTLNTRIIQTAIDKVSENGGGTVYFPRGKFLTGSLMMKSDVTLELDEGAVLLGSTNPSDYYFTEQVKELANPERDDKSALALILAEDVHNIGLIGKGTIDGQGRSLALHIDSLHHTGARVDPKYNDHRNRPNESARPKLFRFSKCNHVTVKNLHLRNSACWGLSFELCSNLVLDSLHIYNRAYWNNDGIDITDSRNVRVTNCYVDAADDAICLKSYFPGHWNDTIYIANCEIRSSASAVKFGTASFGGFKNVTIENIKVFDTFRSAIAIESVDGGFIENVSVNNINAVNTGNAIFIRLGHRSGKKPGTVKNITIKNIKIQVPFGRPDWAYDMRGPALPFFHNQFPSPICGIPGHYIENVVLENIEIAYPGRASKGMAYVPLWRLNMVPEQIESYPEYTMFGELPSWGFYVRHVKNISFKNITLTLDDGDFRPAFVLDDVEGLNMENILLPEGLSQQITLKDSKVEKLDPVAKKQMYIVDYQSFADSVCNYGIEALMPARNYKWDWGQATMLHAVIQMYAAKPEAEKNVYFDYVKAAMDNTMTVANGKHPNAVASGIGMAFLARITGDSVYINKANLIYQDYLGIPRTKQGGVSHRAETVELWDDTIYMLSMFLLEMYRLTGDEKYLREFTEQYKIHKEKLADKKWKLWVHGYDDDTVNYPDRCCQANWADMTPERRSIEFWGRGNGWVVMAIADALNTVPASSEYYTYFAKELRQITSKLPGLQDAETGLWYQLPIYPDDPQNFPESSATAMFAYGMAIGLNHGVLNDSVYKPIVERAYDGLKNHAVRVEGNYMIPTRICEGTCIGDKNHYYGRKTKEAANFAIGAYVMFALEYKFIT